MEFILIVKTNVKTTLYPVMQNERLKYARWKSYPAPIFSGGDHIFNTSLIEALILLCRDIQIDN